MAYADFPYYQDFYLGSMIRDPTAFGRAAERASEYLDMVTFGRLLDGVPDPWEDRIRKCCCALAEAIVTYQAYGTGGAEGIGLKTAETIGAYSVSYATPTESISALLNGETSGLQDYLKSICIRYLGGSGLLYRGV
ncbi:MULTISPECIES: hypothetical protein [Clostridia]|uniref:hypothetical protein n=1 Tax=Clostridia TaxID=186801 RepID=UPI001D02783C|nr:hypothetical protein [Ruminococcus callidus]MCB5776022.1 hypothetical protein [Ruminococcus callidus]MCC2759719.1 hypothetical protein [Ruminococcus callidus]